MISNIKAEFRKLLSVRSTYIITALVVVLVIFIAGYVEGYKLSAQDLHSAGQFTSDVFGALSLSIFGAIVAILLMTHEYRYNTIMYSLTASNSRSKVLLAKIVAISTYAIFLTVIVGVLSPIMASLGVHLHGHTLVPQTMHIGNIVWRSVFYGWAYGMVGLLLAVLIRVQVGAIAALFLIPGLIEQLLTQLLKHSAIYLPFTSLGAVVGDTSDKGDALAPGKAALVFMIYLVVGWAVAWYLFVKRDAN